MSTIYLNNNEPHEALRYLNKALIVQRQVGHRAGEGRTLGSLMLAWKALGQPRLAIFYGKQSVNVFQDIRQNTQKLDRELQNKYLASKQDIYRELAELLINRGRLPEAQQVLDMLKEDEYFEYVRRDSSEASALSSRTNLNPQESDLDRQYREFNQELTAHGQELGELRIKRNRTPAEDDRLRVLVAEITASNQRFQEFLDNLAGKFSSSALAQERIFNIRENQSLMSTLRVLGKNVVALYTIVLEDKYRVIVITPNVQIPREYTISSAALNRKVMALLSALKDPRQDPLPQAKEMYKILIGPIENDLKGVGAETLMWSLDGVLRYIPIAALHDGNDYIVKRYRNVVFTPASRDNLRETPVADWRGLGFGVSKRFGEFNDLPNVPRELSGIIRDENGLDTSNGVMLGRVMLDDAFTEDAMVTALLGAGYPVVHVAIEAIVRLPRRVVPARRWLSGRARRKPFQIATGQRDRIVPAARQGRATDGSSH
jgi:CHAT domain-containing protein